MTTNDILLIGLKQKVAAISKSDGRQIWSTPLRGGFGSSSNFITLLADESRVFAYSTGHLHCLDLSSGRLLWTNELPGFGFGLASLCLPGGNSAPDTTVVENIITQQAHAAAGSAGA